MKQDMNLKRRRMVDLQIVARGVRDPRVIAAMYSVPREVFVSPRESSRSFSDGPLPIGHGQTISQPYIVAYMTEMLELSGRERVLEVGTGSGYQTAVLAELAREVYTVERIPELAEKSRSVICEKLKYENVFFRVGDGKKGWPEAAPFDAILVTASPEKIPSCLEDQLRDPGIMILPVGKYEQRIIRIRKRMGDREADSLLHVSFVPCV